jgi:hypothetical protein
MKRFGLGSYALRGGVAVALLAGCGGSQPISAPGAMPQTTARTTHRERGTSWMLPEAKAEDLLYVVGSEGTYSIVYVLSYPAGKLVGKIIHAISGLCTDAKGDVFLTQTWYSKSRILEYAHGGKKPIATLSDPYTGVGSCAVDPTNGNLAVANAQGGAILVYPEAKGKPKAYNVWFYPANIGYDANGSLFVFDKVLAQLERNGQFQRIKYDRRQYASIGIQWDGQYMALGQSTTNYTSVVQRYTIKGHNGDYKGTVHLEKPSVAFFIEGSTLVTSDGEDDVYFFNYPTGGAPMQTITNIPHSGNVIVSAAP